MAGQPRVTSGPPIERAGDPAGPHGRGAPGGGDDDDDDDGEPPVDHYLGWYGKENPAFDARQKASFRDLRQGPKGPFVATESWGQSGRNNFHGRGFADPSHGWTGGRAERRGGRCDGWLDPATGNERAGEH